MSRAANKLIKAAAGAGAEDTGDNDFANVVLLLDGDGTSGDDNNTFTNSGSTSTTIGTTGDVIQGSFSPYGNNWSVFFDGSNDRLQTASSPIDLGSGDFTVEFWINSTDTSANLFNPVSATGTGYWGLIIQSGDLRWNDAYNVSNLWEVDGAPILDGEWHHVAIVRNSGTFSVYYDGTAQSAQSGSFSDTTNYSGTQGMRIGKGNLDNFKGYLSNVRFISGTAVYTSAFTPPTEPFTNSSSYTEKLLTCQSNRFIDNGDLSLSVTVNDSPKITPFSPFKNDDARDITVDGGSFYIAGSGDHVDISDHNDLDFGTGDFTVEFWVYIHDGTANQDGIISKGNSGSGWQIIYSSTSRLKFIRTSGTSSSPQITTSTYSLEENEWNHIALTRSGTTVTLWIDGVSEGTYTDSTSWDTSEPLRLGTNRGENNDYVGYIADLRIIKGLAVYTAAFTPPTEPLGNLAGSANALTYGVYSGKSFSVSGQETNPQGVRFKPDGTKMYVAGNTGDDVGQYSLSTAWDVSTASFDSVTLSVSSEDTTPNGLAFSSDGTKLYITGNANNRVFQYDLSTAWDLSTASYASKSLLTTTDGAGGPIEPFMRSNGTDFYYLDVNTDTVYQYTLSAANDISTASYASKSFSVASQEANPTGLTFSSDGTKMFVCGQSGDDINQYTLSTAWDVSTASFDSVTLDVSSEAVNPAGIDLKPDGSRLYMISNSGDAVYQYSLSDIPPNLLLNFQDAGIYDRTGNHNIDTVGTAQIDTSVVKYGTGSIEFDGNSDYLLGSENPADVLAITNAFTAECWFYQTATAGTGSGLHALIGHWNNNTGNKAFVMGISSTSMILYVSNDGSTNNISGATGGTVSNNVWNHAALTWDGTNYRVFLNGTAVITQANSSPPYASNEVIQIGISKSGSGGSFAMYYQGYMDDIRITNGVARYTSTFTPPTAALPKF
jgi:hypothetical protein